MTSHSDFVSLCARTPDFELCDAIACELEDLYGYPPNPSKMSFEEAVVYSVWSSEGYGKNHGITGLVALHEYDYAFLVDAYHVLSKPGLAEIYKLVDRRVRETGFNGSDDKEDAAQLFEFNLYGTADDLDTVYCRMVGKSEEALALYIRRNLDHFAHLSISQRLPPDKPFVPENPAFLRYLYEQTQYKQFGGRLPSFQDIKNYSMRDDVKELRDEDYLFMNVGQRIDEFDSPQPYIRYLRPIGGVLYEIRTDGQIRIVQDE